MEPRKKILILTADAGFGHRSAALAVESALCERYGDLVETEIVNPLDDKRTPFFCVILNPIMTNGSRTFQRSTSWGMKPAIRLFPRS